MTHHTSCNNLKANFGILNFWLIAYMLMKISKADNQFLEFSKHDDSVDLENKENVARIYPFRMELFFESLKELSHEETYNRKKKSVTSNEKRIAAAEMKNKIQKLMLNISRTLNDVDWYFTSEQLEDQKNKVKNIANIKPTVKRMREAIDRNSDAFVDSLIKQIYKMNPSILDKINKEFFNVKRQIRLTPAKQSKKAIHKKTNINKIVTYEEPFVYSEDTLHSDEFPIEPPANVSGTPNYLADFDNMLQQGDTNLLINNLDYTDTSSSTTPTTTALEEFYDYGDYYKDRNNPDKIHDISHYEIIQDILQSIHRYNGTDLNKSQIKHQYIKARNFDKSKEMLKKRLKNNLKNYEKSKKHKYYNINYDY